MEIITTDVVVSSLTKCLLNSVHSIEMGGAVSMTTLAARMEPDRKFKLRSDLLVLRSKRS